MNFSKQLCVRGKSQFLWQAFVQNSRLSTSNVEPVKRICVVGAGPAGFYSAQYLLKHLNGCRVDMIEKLPVPFGLVRFGVAPDHPEVKNVINTFTKTAENERFRFFGNVSLSEHISLQELRERYHAVLLTYGADKDRELNIPKEDSSHVISARKFVAWYNGLPGAENLNPDLSGNVVTIVGQGNVAIDVARMLLTPVDLLRKTDTTEYALEALAHSKVNQVYVVGRRGPLQAAFTIKELREMLKLPNVQTIWRPKDFIDIPPKLESLQRPRKRLTELMLKSLSEQTKPTSDKKQFLPIFLRAPCRVVDTKEIEFNVTELKEESAVPTSEIERLPADLILRSIGYKSTCVDNSICFDERNGKVFNSNGRVLKQAEATEIDKGLYVSGWLATGPTGVIITTMNGAFLVAKQICDDILSGLVPTNMQKDGIDISGKRIVTWSGYKRIDEAEIEAGKALGKPREKIVRINKMLQIAGV